MRRPSTAALTRFAAICGFLVAPSAGLAQLQCRNPGTDVQIRRVSFEGNETFSDAELASHVVSTATDFTRSYLFLDKRLIPVGAALGGAIGALGAQEKLKRGVLFAGAGALLGYAISEISGVERCLRLGTLAGDILNLGGFYRDQGFADVRVDTTAVVAGRWAYVTFQVTEGRPVLVDSLEIIGFDTTTMGSFPERLRSRKGGRYSPTITQEDVDSLETRLRNSGYPEGIALREVDFRSGARLANVKFTIEAGPRARIGKVNIRRDALPGRSPSVGEDVVRRLLRFAPGDFYSQRALFESERRFYRTGTFLSAEIAPDISHVRGDSLVDVQVTVVEDLTHSFSFEPGLGTLDCFRARVDYSDKAFLGDVNRLEISTSASKLGLAPPTQRGLLDACRFLQGNTSVDDISSSKVNYNGTVRATRPVPLAGGLLPSISVYTERRGGYQAYLRTTLIGGALSVSKSITRTILWEQSYNLEYGRTEALPPVLCFLFRACDESARDQLTSDKPLAVLGARFSRDRRNFADSASAGTVVRLDLRGSHRFIASDRSLQFAKGVVDASWYRRVGPGVVAARGRAGLIGLAQELSGGTSLPPPQERLYAGGETSVRGFRQNELGPVIYITSDTALSGVNSAPDDAARTLALQNLDVRVIPAGGNAMYVGNLEYRLQRQVLLTQAIVFVDVGAVSTDAGFAAIAGSKQFRVTPGIALKYFSPVGPVQINIGYNSYDPLAGPVFSDRADPTTLTCISGTEASGACRPLPAIRPRTGFFKKLTFTVAFPPDF